MGLNLSRKQKPEKPEKSKKPEKTAKAGRPYRTAHKQDWKLQSQKDYDEDVNKKQKEKATEEGHEEEEMEQESNTCLSIQLQAKFLNQLQKFKRKTHHTNEDKRDARKALTPHWDDWTFNFVERLYKTVGRDTQDGCFTLKHFVAACARVGYSVTAKAARDRFWNANKSKDGFLTVDEFFVLTYYFDPPKTDGSLNGLAQNCALAAKAERFIKALDADQRLMFGLI